MTCEWISILLQVMSFFENSLATAIIQGNVSEVQDFFKHGLRRDYVFTATAHESRLGKTLIELAVSSGQLDVLKALIGRGCDVNYKVVVDMDNYKIKVKPYHRPDR